MFGSRCGCGFPEPRYAEDGLEDGSKKEAPHDLGGEGPEGVDTDFGKDPHFLLPVVNPPFYAPANAGAPDSRWSRPAAL